LQSLTLILFPAGLICLLLRVNIFALIIYGTHVPLSTLLLRRFNLPATNYHLHSMHISVLPRNNFCGCNYIFVLSQNFQSDCVVIQNPQGNDCQFQFSWFMNRYSVLVRKSLFGITQFSIICSYRKLV